MAKGDNHLNLIIVVSGAPEPVRLNHNQRLEHAVREALRESGNHGQRPEEWELRNENGQLLALSLQADEAGLVDGQTLFLSPKAGAGG